MSEFKTQTESYQVTKPTSPTVLLCSPKYFDVVYKINPWMRPAEWHEDLQHLSNEAKAGWRVMRDQFAGFGWQVKEVEPQPGLPDMVFTANAAIVLDGKALMAKFKFKERQGEEQFFCKKFEELKTEGLINQIGFFPEGIKQEGAGDCVWDATRNYFWTGRGPRSDKEASKYISDFFGVETVPIELVTDDYYHSDISINPLSGGHLMFYPGAFSEASCKVIRERVEPELLIEVDQEDAQRFVLNAVNIGPKIALSGCSEKLEHKLTDFGYEVVKIPVGAFNFAGGSVWCLTLRLDLAQQKNGTA
jgi:N-dimethylarginine dimethylaminohydrolase